MLNCILKDKLSLISIYSLIIYKIDIILLKYIEQVTSNIFNMAENIVKLRLVNLQERICEVVDAYRQPQR